MFIVSILNFMLPEPRQDVQLGPPRTGYGRRGCIVRSMAGRGPKRQGESVWALPVVAVIAVRPPLGRGVSSVLLQQRHAIVKTVLT